MKLYAHYGSNEFVLCLGHKGNMIKEYFLNYRLMNSDFTVDLGGRSGITINNSRTHEDWIITLAETGEAAMTGGRIKRIEKYIDTDYFLLTYGDGVADLDIRQLVEFHLSHERIGTVTGVYPSSRFGELILAHDGHEAGHRVLRFREKPLRDTRMDTLPVPAAGQIHGRDEGFINGGFFVFNTAFFRYLTDDDGCVLEREPLENLASEGQLYVFKHKGFWQCMDTYRELVLLNHLWETPRPPWKVWHDGSPNVCNHAFQPPWESVLWSRSR
jgi:glucose-1-phosphate cytidylyltransferase